MNRWVDRMKVTETAIGGSEFRSQIGFGSPPSLPEHALMPGSRYDFHTQDFIPSPLDPTALAVRQARGIHSIQPFLEICLPCRFFKAFGKQNCWMLIGIGNQTGQEEEVPMWVRRVQLS